MTLPGFLSGGCQPGAVTTDEGNSSCVWGRGTHWPLVGHLPPGQAPGNGMRFKASKKVPISRHEVGSPFYLSQLRHACKQTRVPASTHVCAFTEPGSPDTLESPRAYFPQTCWVTYVYRQNRRESPVFTAFPPTSAKENAPARGSV